MKGQTQVNYYAVLGVAHTASEEEIRAAYKSGALKCHPDRNKDGNAEAMFKQVGEAYEHLSDPQKKRAHDVKWGYVSAAPQTQPPCSFPSRMPHAWEAFQREQRQRAKARQEAAARRQAEVEQERKRQAGVAELKEKLRQYDEAAKASASAASQPTTTFRYQGISMPVTKSVEQELAGLEETRAQLLGQRAQAARDWRQLLGFPAENTTHVRANPPQPTLSHVLNDYMADGRTHRAYMAGMSEATRQSEAAIKEHLARMRQTEPKKKRP